MVFPEDTDVHDRFFLIISMYGLFTVWIVIFSCFIHTVSYISWHVNLAILSIQFQYYTVSRKKRCHFIFDYNSYTSQSILKNNFCTVGNRTEYSTIIYSLLTYFLDDVVAVHVMKV